MLYDEAVIVYTVYTIMLRIQSYSMIAVVYSIKSDMLWHVTSEVDLNLAWYTMMAVMLYNVLNQLHRIHKYPLIVKVYCFKENMLWNITSDAILGHALYMCGMW
jgi:hypothetical protein